MNKKYIGLDLGTTTLGIASSDSLGIVHGKENFKFEKGNYKKAREHLIEFIITNGIYDIVLGLPLQLDRKEGERCQSARRFALDLKNECPKVNINFYDESFTTIAARERLHDLGMKEEKIKSIIDMESAIIILEDFLRSQNNGK